MIEDNTPLEEALSEPNKPDYEFNNHFNASSRHGVSRVLLKRIQLLEPSSDRGGAKQDSGLQTHVPMESDKSKIYSLDAPQMI